jgi:hypothetical protein
MDFIQSGDALLSFDCLRCIGLMLICMVIWGALTGKRSR